MKSMKRQRDRTLKGELPRSVGAQYATGDQVTSSFPRLDFGTLGELTFEKPDLEKFPNLQHAYTALSQGGNIPCVVNAANEVCVAAFLADRIRFTDMPRLIEKAMQQTPYILQPTLEDYLATDREVRNMVETWI